MEDFDARPGSSKYIASMRIASSEPSFLVGYNSPVWRVPFPLAISTHYVSKPNISSNNAETF